LDRLPKPRIESRWSRLEVVSVGDVDARGLLSDSSSRGSPVPAAPLPWVRHSAAGILLSGSEVRVTVTVISGRAWRNRPAPNQVAGPRGSLHNIKSKADTCSSTSLSRGSHTIAAGATTKPTSVCARLEACLNRAIGGPTFQSSHDHANVSRTGLYGAASGPRPGRAVQPIPADGVCPKDSSPPRTSRPTCGWATAGCCRGVLAWIVSSSSERRSRVIEPRRLKKATRSPWDWRRTAPRVYVHTEGFLGGSHSANEFRFMSTEVSRDAGPTRSSPRGSTRRRHRAVTSSGWRDALVHSRAGRLRVVHSQRVRAGGPRRQCVAVHDIEAAIFGTTWA
jgi:hypothetical protein